jgi:hypothetical protein
MRLKIASEEGATFPFHFGRHGVPMKMSVDFKT